MRILPERPDHGSCCTAGEDAASERHRDHRIYGGEHLPLRNLCAHPTGDPTRGERRRCKVTSLSRRTFLKTSTAAGTGLLIGLYLPSCSKARAKNGLAPNAYVTITPEGKITI